MMKYLTPALFTGATITVAVTTGLAHAHAVHASLLPYLCGYGIAVVMFAVAVAMMVEVRAQVADAPPQPSFVLEVAGTPPLRSNADWKFFLTNCSLRILRYVQLSTIRSEIGAYDIFFKEVQVMQPGEKIVVGYDVSPRRTVDRDMNRKATLWDFALDNAGERGSTYLWYDIFIQYRDTDDSVRDGRVVGVFFDIQDEILKTEGAEYWRKNNWRAQMRKLDRG